MALQYRRRRPLGGGAFLNVSRRGVSVSKRIGRVTLSSSGRGSLRIVRGLSFRWGGRR